MTEPLFRNVLRLATIMRVFTRHGLFVRLEASGLIIGGAARFLGMFTKADYKNETLGKRLAKSLEVLGPTFIKFGQALSMRPDVVGQDIASELELLRDSLPSFPGEEARAIIADTLGGEISEYYQSFDDRAVAAASIAQVHFAVSLDGAKVAVKVLRPGVEDLFFADIALFRRVARLCSWLFPNWRRLRLEDVVKTFEDSIVMEMDLRFEAAAASEMTENFTGDDTIYIPKIDWRRTGRRVLTEERIEGVSIGQKEAMLEAGIDLAEVTARSAEAFFNMVFRDGFFHADMHPGNLFVSMDGKLILVDFGIMGRLDYDTRRYLGEMLIGLLTRDYRRVAKMHFEAGYVSSHRSVDDFTQAIRSIAEPIFGRPQNEISIARLLEQLFQVTKTFDMEVQPQLLFLQKSMLVAEGLGRYLYPEANMWQLAAPMIEKWIVENLGPAARVRNAVEDVAEAMGNLPGLLADIARHGPAPVNGIRLHPDTLRALQSPPCKYAWAPWLVAAVFALLWLLD